MCPSAFRDIGRVANASEPRTCVLNKGTDGDFYFIICAYEFITCTNLRTGESSYHPYPDGYKAFPYGSFGAKSGKVYIGAGRYLFEFDPVLKAYTYAGMPHPDEVIGADAWSFAEDPNGILYFGAFPKTYLTGFDPKTRTFIDYGIMDPAEQYLESVAVGQDGWIYCGIGTSKREIMAVHPVTHEKRVLGILEEAGSATVYNSCDGRAFATLKGSHLPVVPNEADGWFELTNGAIGLPISESIKWTYEKTGFHAIHCPYADRPRILRNELVDHDLCYIHPETGEETEVYLPYETTGAYMSPLTAGPDGKVYGSTNHPFQFYSYDPKTDTLTNYGLRKTVPLGNICAYAVQGHILGGAAYCGGHIMRIDTTKPICQAYDENPHCETSIEEILRPRSACAMPDGRNMVFGGYNAYGVTGGGLVVYDAQARTCRVIENKKLLRFHSVLAIVPMSEDCILCGTCIGSPGGGVVEATQAELFLYDLTKEEVIYSIVPVPGAYTIAHMQAGTDGLIHGITSDSVHFVFDPSTRTVVHTQDLSAYGEVPRQGMQKMADGTIWGILGRAVYCIDPGAKDARIAVETPDGLRIDLGLAIIENKLYFGSGTHLWEYTM